MGRGKEREPMIAMKNRTPLKGYIPVLVGQEPMKIERFLLHVELFNDPRIAALLEKAAYELGYRQQGILRILCDANHFRRMVDEISKAN